MSAVTGVRFRQAGKVYYFDASGHEDLRVDDMVIVDTSRGREAGKVVIAPDQVTDTDMQGLKPVIRKAGWRELSELARLRTQEEAALCQAAEHIEEHELPMRAVKAEYNFDGSQLTIYFVTEEQRVDFRKLVRDLARAFRTRVHLRQIGPRDRAKLIGGIDRCGLELCCTTWMTDFEPIGIRMAKNQNLPLNPSEISGVCGKLLCCLSFEEEQYRELKKGLPKVGSRLTSAVGSGRVVDVNVLTRKITISWETGSRVVVDADEFDDLRSRKAEAAEASDESS
jgi:cell fate regulator YaaT (PSP1 superfamily)